MGKRKIDGPTYPYPTVLVGANVEGRANFMTVGWLTMANARPPVLAVSLGRGRRTMHGIQENRTFSVNIATADMVEGTDYCGMVSGKDTDKSRVFDVAYGELGNAPMVQESPLTMECRVTNIVELPDHSLVLGEVVATYLDDRYITDGRPDLAKMRPLILTMPDTQYWTLGERIAQAWSVGKGLKH